MFSTAILPPRSSGAVGGRPDTGCAHLEAAAFRNALTCRIIAAIDLQKWASLMESVLIYRTMTCPIPEMSAPPAQAANASFPAIATFIAT